MDELISNTIKNVEKFGDDEELLICMLARDVYLNDIIYVDRCPRCCQRIKKHGCEGIWKEYKQLQWYDMNMPDDLIRKLSKLTSLIQNICEKILNSSFKDRNKCQGKNKTVLALMRVSTKISSGSYDCDKIIKCSKKLYRVNTCPCQQRMNSESSD